MPERVKPVVSLDTWQDRDDVPPLTREWFTKAEIRDGERVVRRGRPRPNKA